MFRKHALLYILMILPCFCIQAIATEQLVRYPLGSSQDDFRYAYPVRVLQLALDNTAEEYGAVRAVNTTIAMKTSRIISELKKGRFLDVITSGANRDLEKDLLSVPICIRKGILGIRLFLIDKESQSQFSDIRELDDLKNCLWAREPIGLILAFLRAMISKS